MLTKPFVLVVATFISVVAALSVWSVQSEGVRVIGVVTVSAPPSDFLFDSMRAGLHELGYIEGRDIRIEVRTAEGRVDRLPALIEELLRLKADILVISSSEGARAAKQATSTVPIVALLYNQDPMATGLIESFNRPGGNLTGTTVRNFEHSGKRIQLLKEMIPGLSRIAVFWDSLSRVELQGLSPAAHSLGIQLQFVELDQSYDLDTAFKSAKSQRAGAVLVLTSPQFYVKSARLGALALENKLPVASVFYELTKAGGLMSYSTDPAENFHRSAYFIDRLLKGAKPSDLPFEQTENIKPTVNLKAADALGIKVPQSVLLRADSIIR